MAGPGLPPGPGTAGGAGDTRTTETTPAGLGTPIAQAVFQSLPSNPTGKDAFVVDRQNIISIPGGMPDGDPIRDDYAAGWVYVSEVADTPPHLAWLREFGREGFNTAREDQSVINQITINNEVLDESVSPYGSRFYQLDISFKQTRFVDTDELAEHLISEGYGNYEKEYFDHALEYQEAFSPRESFLVFDGSPPSGQLISEVKYDYNFYTQAYERLISLGIIPETIVPNMYTFFLESERGLGAQLSRETTRTDFLGDEQDVSYNSPRINQESYNQNWIYNDFITLNRYEKSPRVFLNTFRLGGVGSSDLTDQQKAGERDRGEYFDIWSENYPNALNTVVGGNPLIEGLEILEEKYRNVIIPSETVNLIHTDYNIFKELFPMYAEVNYSQTSPNYFMSTMLSRLSSLGSLANNLMRDVCVDFLRIDDGSLPETAYGSTAEFGENHQQVDMSTTAVTLSGQRPLRTIGGGATRKLYNIGEWARRETAGSTALFGDAKDKFLFLRNYRADPSAQYDTILEDLALTSYASDQVRDIIERLVATHARTYDQILQGARAYSEDVFFKINKYRVASSGARVPTPIQTFYLPNDASTRSVVNLIDTQLKYNQTYEYEILTYRLVIGSKTRIMRTFYFNPEDYIPRTAGPGFDIIGRFEPLDVTVPAPVTEETPENPFGATAPATPTTPVELVAPSMTVGGNPPPLFARVELQLSPSIQLIELPYVSPFTSGMNVLRGTMLDDPPMPPEVEIIPYRGISNRVLLSLNTGLGSHQYIPITFSREEDEYIERLRQMIIDPNEQRVLYETDDPSVSFEIYRMERRPRSYREFAGNLIRTVRTNTDIIGFQNASSAGVRDTIDENKKYYYMFRAIDIHGHLSMPSPVYEVEMVNNDGAIYPIVRVVEFSTPDEQKTRTKNVNRFLKISPAIMQRTLNTEQLEEINGAPLETAPSTEDLPLGYRDVAVWGKKYKVRVTSKKTGKKVDLNISFTKEYNNTRPVTLPNISAAPGGITATVNAPGTTNRFVPVASVFGTRAGILTVGS